MTNANNDVRELEELLTELEGQGALSVGAYGEEEDAVTQLMDAPLGDQEWMVQITPLDRRMMTTDQVRMELGTGNLVRADTLVWRTGMSDWAPISRMEELAGSTSQVPVPSLSERRPLPPPPTPVPPQRLPTGTMVSPGAPPPPPPVAVPPNGSASGASALNGSVANGGGATGSSSMGSPSTGTFSSSQLRTPLPPPPPSVPFGVPKLTPVPDLPPAPPLPLLNSAFGSPGLPMMPELDEPSHSETGSFYVPLPAAPPQPPATSRTSSNTSSSRPVAVDFSEVEPARATPARILIGSGIAAAAMIIGTVFALSAGGVFESDPEPKREAAAAASQPAPSSAPEMAKPAEPSPAAKPSSEKAAAAAQGESDGKERQTQPAAAKEEIVAAPESKASKEGADDEPRAKAESDRKAEGSRAESASEDSADGSASPARGSRAERRLAARLRKRAQAAGGTAADEREEKPRASSPRASKPRATAVAPSDVAEADEAPKGAEAPGSTFNRQAAKTALDDAAAQARNCRPQGGPSGSGKVQVRYEPTGKVGAVSILTPEFDNTTTGSCLVMVFRRASIPAFNGSQPVVMNKNFEIP